MILNALKTGLFSHSADVIVNCLEVLTKISEVTFEMPIYPAVYQWFITSQEGGISAVLYVLKKFEDITKHVVSTIVAFAKDNLPSILKETIKSLYPSPREYTAAVNNFIHVLADDDKSRTELLDAGLIDYYLETSVSSADNDGKNSPEERTAALAFACDLWVLFPDKLKAREDLSAQIISTLKNVCVDKFRPLRI